MKIKNVSDCVAGKKMGRSYSLLVFAFLCDEGGIRSCRLLFGHLLRWLLILLIKVFDFRVYFKVLNLFRNWEEYCHFQSVFLLRWFTNRF